MKNGNVRNIEVVKTNRQVYKIEKGNEHLIGYLFLEDLRYWESRGYTVTLTS